MKKASLLPLALAIVALFASSRAEALPDVTLVFNQNLTVSGGAYTRLILPQSGMDGGYTYTLTTRPILGEAHLYGDPYIYGIVYHTGSSTLRVRRVSRFSGDAIEQTSMDGSLQDQGEDNAEFRIYCETSVSSCKVQATIHMRAPGGNDPKVFYTEGREPGVADNQIYVDKDFYHPTEHTGDYGLQVLYESGEYIYLFRSSGASVSGSSSLSFWVRSAGSIDETDLWVVLTNSSHATKSPWRNLANYVTIAQSHTWYRVVVPLSELGATSGSVYGVAIKSDQAGIAYFDEIQFSNDTNLLWPIQGGFNSGSVTSPFGDDWIASCGGLIKKHTGTDVSANSGATVKAAHSGTVREKVFDSQWGTGLVIEDVSGQFSAVYWHINTSLAVGNSVTRGDTVGTVANLGSNTHFHFGFWNGSFVSNRSIRGALPQQNCDGDPAFPSSFLNAANMSYSSWN